MKISQSYEIERSVPALTSPSLPDFVDLSTIGGYLSGVYFATDDANAFSNLYYRILSKGTAVFPGNTGQPISASVPRGWAAAPARVVHNLNIFVPNGGTLRVEFVNLHATLAVKIYLMLTVQSDTLINQLEDINQNIQKLAEALPLPKTEIKK